MSNRDEFSQSTKNRVAARAGWPCSFEGCTQGTHGPSAESPEAVSNIGVAAHICAAAPGPGARRYDKTMSREERSGIGNAIWLCANHATLIDRDEVTYTAARLRAMKAAREKASEEEQRSGKGASLFAIGPDIVCTGDLAQVTSGSWTLHLKHFVAGDRHELVGLLADLPAVRLKTGIYFKRAGRWPGPLRSASPRDGGRELHGDVPGRPARSAHRRAEAWERLRVAPRNKGPLC
ncbi:hypothetical protein [Ensifer aridi]|uniref:hypothetical protein n=1 Tax=Ensifer aridi TaxID=1708715 RepID=UPI001AEC7B42|nr:hypothetical protein [Ensifer aridi]